MVIGVDPGKSGGVAVIENGVAQLFNMPTRRVGSGKKARTCYDEEAIFLLFNKLLYERFVVSIFIEDIPLHTGVNRSAAFMMPLFGNFKLIQGFVRGLGFAPQCITPQRWQELVGVQRDPELKQRRNGQTIWKNQLKDRAMTLFPAASVTLSTCDALLIAHAGQRILQP